MCIVNNHAILSDCSWLFYPHFLAFISFIVT
jgi:hypothetical protein